MNLTLEIKNQPLKDDILIYNGTQWESVGKSHIVSQLSKRVREQEDELNKLKSDMEILKQGVNDKLKTYHNILQNLVKGE